MEMELDSLYICLVWVAQVITSFQSKVSVREAKSECFKGSCQNNVFTLRELGLLQLNSSKAETLKLQSKVDLYLSRPIPFSGVRRVSLSSGSHCKRISSHCQEFIWAYLLNIMVSVSSSLIIITIINNNCSQCKLKQLRKLGFIIDSRFNFKVCLP